VTAALSCRAVSRNFGALRAVDHVDLAVRPGARHALIGPNGAGKTTLFRLITGLLRVTDGQIELDGRDITRLSEVRRARLGIGQTLQHASLFASMTAAQNVALAVRRHERGVIPVVPVAERAVWTAALYNMIFLGVVGLVFGLVWLCLLWFRREVARRVAQSTQDT